MSISSTSPGIVSSADNLNTNNNYTPASLPLAGSTTIFSPRYNPSITLPHTERLTSSQPEFHHQQHNLSQYSDSNNQYHHFNSPSNISLTSNNNMYSDRHNINIPLAEHEKSQHFDSIVNMKKLHYSHSRKQSQLSDEISIDNSSCPYGCCHTTSTSEYIFLNGLVKGDHYDVVIKAFGKKYKLHKFFLDRSLYFKSLFSWSTNASNSQKLKNTELELDSDSDSSSDSEYSDYRKVYDLQFDDDNDIDDDNLKEYQQKSFELAISRLYGAINLKEEYKIPYNMIRMGQYLSITDVVCTATDFIVKNMSMSNLAENLRFAITSDYGSASQRIIENGKGILCSNGWEKGPDAWDGIPTSIAADVLGEDYFFVPTEWERCIFIIKLIERRLEASNFDDEIENVLPLKKVLNEKIYYCHMPPDQLQELEELCDVNGVNYIESHVLHASLWQAVQLETLVTRAHDSLHLDNMVTSSDVPSTNHRWFKIPSKDETLSGLPKELDSLLNQSLSTTVTNQLNSDDSKTTQNETKSIDDDEKLFNWTKIPPFRFSIAFSNVSELSTDKRVYGKTFWYAGSYWNLYLQKSHISSKNSYQVGVYLHRAHNGLSNSSTKNGSINPDIYFNNINYKSLPKNYRKKNQTNILSHTVPVGRNGRNSLSSDELDRTNNNNDSKIDSLAMNMHDLSISDDQKSTLGRQRNTDKKPVINYEDQRTAIKVYFIIFTPSRRSIPTITSFLSVPNDFSISQSWGWKSNNMCVFNEDGTFTEDQDPDLKFMILLGNV